MAVLLGTANGSGRLERDELARLVNENLGVRDLRRIRQCRIELLLAHPVGRDAGRFLGMLRGIEEADGTQDAVIGHDQVIALEARQFAQAGNEAALSLLDELVAAVLIDRVVASNGGMHVMLPSISSVGTTRLSHPGAPKPEVTSKGACELDDVGGGLWAAHPP